MSNNAPDYENDLVFPPQEIKSQDDIKHQDTRSSDVLIKAVEKCEKLEKQLGVAKAEIYFLDGKVTELDEQLSEANELLIAQYHSTHVVDVTEYINKYNLLELDK